jgi:hypothetical protein
MLTLYSLRKAASVAFWAATTTHRMIAELTPILDEILEKIRVAKLASATAAAISFMAAAYASKYTGSFVKDVNTRAKNRKKNTRQNTALDKLKGVVMQQSRNKKFVATAFEALEKWNAVQRKVDKELSKCRLVKVSS